MGMGTTLSTLSNLAIYIGLVVVGAFLGSRKALRSRPLAWVGKLQFAALMILIVTLGINLGANDEVVSSLGQIGLAALVITVLAMGRLPAVPHPAAAVRAQAGPLRPAPGQRGPPGRRRPTTAARRTTPSPSSLSLP